MCWERGDIRICVRHTRCFMHAYLILQYVSKIILAYSLAYTRCFMQAFHPFVWVWYLAVSVIHESNACMLSSLWVSNVRLVSGICILEASAWLGLTQRKMFEKFFILYNIKGNENWYTQAVNTWMFFLSHFGLYCIKIMIDNTSCSLHVCFLPLWVSKLYQNSAWQILGT